MMLPFAARLRAETLCKDENGMKKAVTDEFFKLVKFGMTGVMNTAVDFFVFMLLSYVGVYTYLAQMISYSCGMLNSYIVNRSWTFKSRERFLSPQLVRFVISNFLQMILSVLLMWLLITKCGMVKMVAKIFATVIILLIGFFINRIWVFGKS